MRALGFGLALAPLFPPLALLSPFLLPWLRRLKPLAKVFLEPIFTRHCKALMDFDFPHNLFYA